MVNPYSQPLPFNQNERKALRPLTAGVPIPPRTTTKAATATQPLSTIEEEGTSPTIRRILEATGCSSRQELLAMRAAQASQQVNTNGSKSAATNGAKPNGAKPAAMNRAKSAATNRSTSATNGNKAINGSKATTNPKKKAKSKQFY